MKSTSKPPFYSTKVIPEPFTHIKGRFRRILYVEHHRQGRWNVGFPNFSRSGSVRPLRTKSIPKTGLGGRRDSGTEEKEGKKDVKTTLTRREKGRRKNSQATGRRGRSPTRGPDPATRTEPNPLRSAQYLTVPTAQSLQPKTHKPSYGPTRDPKAQSKADTPSPTQDPKAQSKADTPSPTHLHFSFSRAGLSPTNNWSPATTRNTVN